MMRLRFQIESLVFSPLSSIAVKRDRYADIAYSMRESWRSFFRETV